MDTDLLDTNCPTCGAISWLSVDDKPFVCGHCGHEYDSSGNADETKLKREVLYVPEGRSGEGPEDTREKVFTVFSKGVEMRLAITDERLLVVSNDDKDSPFALSVPFSMLGTLLLVDQNLTVFIDPDDVFECAFRDGEQAKQAQQMLSEGVMRTR